MLTIFIVPEIHFFVAITVHSSLYMMSAPVGKVGRAFSLLRQLIQKRLPFITDTWTGTDLLSLTNSLPVHKLLMVALLWLEIS